MEREGAPISSVRSIPMIAPTLVVLVRILILVLRGRRQDVYWMVADLAPGKRIFVKLAGVPLEQPWIDNRVGTWSAPGGRENRVESQAFRQSPDHYPRLQ